MNVPFYELEERCCVCGQVLEGYGPQKGLCDACMQKYREEGLAPKGHKCPLCGERRRRNFVLHEASGEYLCQPCRDAVASLPAWKQDLRALRGRFSRRLGPS